MGCWHNLVPVIESACQWPWVGFWDACEGLVRLRSYCAVGQVAIKLRRFRGLESAVRVVVRWYPRHGVLLLMVAALVYIEKLLP